MKGVAAVMRPLVGGLALAIAGAGCTTGLGPRALRSERPAYNDRLLESHNAEMLLNLVRLRYDDPTLFLQVGSVVTNYKYAGTLSGSGSLESNPLGTGGTVGLGYQEQPTITYSPLIGQAFAQRMLTPLPLESIMLFEQGGWSAYRLFAIGIGQVNDVYNAPTADGPTPLSPPDYETFLDLADRLERLRGAQLVGFNWEFRGHEHDAGDHTAHGRGKHPHEKRPAGDDDAPSSGHEPGGLPRLWLREPADPASPLAADVAAVRRMLDLPPDLAEFKLDSFPYKRKPDHVGVRSRSLLGTMFFLSKAIEVPPEHLAAGLVAITRNADGTPFDWRRVTGRLLSIHSQKSEPSNAWIAVQSRGWWFWIADDDPNSKATFTLLCILYSLQQLTGQEKAPVLTLPVGG